MLAELPWELGNLQLQTLELSHNPLLIPPKQILQKVNHKLFSSNDRRAYSEKQGTPTILDWLQRNAEKGRKAKESGLGVKDLRGQDF